MNRQGVLNCDLDQAGIRNWCEPGKKAGDMLSRAYDRLGLSARGYHRVLKLARTIADCDYQDKIQEDHVALALKMRCLDHRTAFGSV